MKAEELLVFAGALMSSHSPYGSASSDALPIVSACLRSFGQHSGGRGRTDRAAVEVHDGSSPATR